MNGIIGSGDIVSLEELVNLGFQIEEVCDGGYFILIREWERITWNEKYQTVVNAFVLCNVN